ncbi:MAG TPA: GIY-YIG nuclease family protein [Acidobacteriaceae bacterium]|nr:GIY-YIG nuclease family protein [Acidobacteriaceae bacterium]
MNASEALGHKFPAAGARMAFVYVLYSRTTKRHYTGATSDLERRLSEHNSDLSPATRYRGPWDLVYQEELATIREALQRERYFKTGRGREELKRLPHEPLA